MAELSTNDYYVRLVDDDHPPQLVAGDGEQQGLLDDLSKPVAFYGDDSGLIHMFVDCAERLGCLYRNMGGYEPPSTMIDLTAANETRLRDGLTKALAAQRRAAATPDQLPSSQP